MSLAAIAERDAWAAGDEGRALELLAHQAEFARDHLLAWVPGYCAVLREASRVPFYAALGALTERVVTDDRVLLIEFLARVADERSTGGTRRTGGKTSEHTI